MDSSNKILIILGILFTICIFGIGYLLGIASQQSDDGEICVPRYSGVYNSMLDNIGVVVYDLMNETQSQEFNQLNPNWLRQDD